MGGSQSSPTPTSDEIEAVRDRREMSSMVSGIVLDPSERLFDSCWRGDVKGCKRDLRDGAHVDWAEWRVIAAAVGNELVVVTPIEACSEMFAGLTTGRGLGRSYSIALRLSSSMFFGWS